MSKSRSGPVWRMPAVRIAAALLLSGIVLLPLLIFLCGVTFLGRYQGAGLAHTYATVYLGLVSGSPASWIVVLGPGLLWVLFHLIKGWWRIGL